MFFRDLQSRPPDVHLGIEASKLALADRQVYRTGLTLAGRTEKGATVLVRAFAGEALPARGP